DFTLKNNRFSHHGTSWISQKPIIIQEIESNKKQVKSSTDFKTKPFKVTSLTDNIEIKIDNEIIRTLPIRLQEIQKSIEDSYYILELEDDWDDEGGVPVDKNTFIRGIRFLINYSVWLLHNQNFLLAPPQINPGPDGSIDILWRTNHYRML